MSERRTVWYGFGLDENAVPVPASQHQVEYSIDPWADLPTGYVSFQHEGREYAIAREQFIKLGWEIP